MQFDYRETCLGVFSGLEAGVMVSFFMAKSVKLLQVFTKGLKLLSFSALQYMADHLNKKKKS